MGTDDGMTCDNADLATYYQQRAPHYDEVYAKAERQADFRDLEAVLPALFTRRDVLEVAAGTGYWTSIIATTATSITATDYNSGPLAIAVSRSYPRRNVRLQQADAFALDQLHGTFTAVSSAPGGHRSHTSTPTASCTAYAPASNPAHRSRSSTTATSKAAATRSPTPTQAATPTRTAPLPMDLVTGSGKTSRPLHICGPQLRPTPPKSMCSN
jgi:hypothetical protein